MDNLIYNVCTTLNYEIKQRFIPLTRPRRKNPSRKRGLYQSSEEIAWCAMVVHEFIGIETVVLLFSK